MDGLLVEILIGVAIAIFLIFIYTLFFFNWSKNINFWSKQKQISRILEKYKRCTDGNINKCYSEMKNLFKDDKGEHLDKLHYTLKKYLKKELKNNKQSSNIKFLTLLLEKMQAKSKYISVSKNFQILFQSIDTQLSSGNLNIEQVQKDITLLFNKIGEVEENVNFSKKGYWVGVIGIIVSVLICVLQKVF